jgi:hypothetical protein
MAWRSARSIEEALATLDEILDSDLWTDANLRRAEMPK